MPIKLPTEITFYYEASDIRDRLLYCIPAEILNKMVRTGEARENILEDYPDGIDIKVSARHFDECREIYGLKLPSSPDRIHHAFRFLRFKSGRRKFPRAGFIRLSYLLKLSDYLSENIDPGLLEAPRERDISPDITVKSQKGILGRKYKRSEELKKKYRKLSLPDYDPTRSIPDQGFSKVKMSEGEEPFSFISRIKQKK